ncbi:Uncharacterized protein Adt_21324 [Abeliophyllum distichum]|uniref:Uncharacterized protein n=1 Tax=Abeliophyllum distichum TaxID=126358 RepID=A0ABD1SZ72_9LAMI
MEKDSHVSFLNNQVTEMRVSLESYYGECSRLKVEAKEVSSRALVKYRALFDLMPDYESMADYLQNLDIKEDRKLVQSKMSKVDFEFLTELGVDHLDVERDFDSFNSLETIEDVGKQYSRGAPTSNL